MAKSIGVITKKRRGRPVTTGKGTLIGVRLPPLDLAALDKWIAKQPGEMNRPEALRAMMAMVFDLGLKAKAK